MVQSTDSTRGSLHVLENATQEAPSADRGDWAPSLHFKLVLAAAVTLAISLTTVAGILVTRQTTVLHLQIDRSLQGLRTQVLDHARLFTEDLAATVATHLRSSGTSGLDAVLTGVRKRDPNVIAALVIGPDGAVVAHTQPLAVGAKPRPDLEPGTLRVSRDGADGEYAEIVAAIAQGDELSGRLEVRYDLRPLARQADASVENGSKVIATSTSLAIGVALLVGAAGLVLIGVVSRRLLKPIYRLADDASSIADGNIDHQVRAIAAKDEFGVLARQFERMRLSIKSYISELVVARQEAEGATKEEQRLRAEIERHSQLLETKVEQRTAELQATNQRLQEYDRLKSEFLSNVSHELRSPLAAISSAAKIISRYGDDSRHGDKRFSSVIIDEARRLGRLIDDLLDLAKIEAGRVEWKMATIEDAGEILDHVVSTFGPMFDDRGIELAVDVERPLPTVVGDIDRLIQVVTNLCSNAMKYTPQDGKVQLSARADELDGRPAIRFTVEDNGAGIPGDQLEHVFERFHQVKSSINTNKPKGTGLGLAICREVVAHHAGRIWAEAPDGGGTRMVFVVPATAPAPRTDEPRPAAVEAPPST